MQLSAPLDERGAARRPRAWTDAAGWIWLAAVLIFLVAFLLPRKGVEFSDEGWVLSASLAAARGWHLDTVVPQAPMWALNALLMAAGVESYISMRWLFYGLISICLAAALTAVCGPRRFDGTAAGLVTLAGLTTMSSLVSYNTAPPYLVLAGAALFALSADARQQRIGRALSILAGLSLSIAGFLNFTIYPAAAAAIGIAWMAGERPRFARLAATTMAVVSGTAIAWYLSAIGLDTFFRYPGGHGIDTSRLQTAVRIVLEWLLVGAAASACVAVATRRQTPDRRRIARHTAAAVLVLGVSAYLLLYLLHKVHLAPLGEPLGRVLTAARTLKLTNFSMLDQGLAPHVMAMWGIAVLGITAVLCRDRDPGYRRTVMFAACLFACYVCQEFFSLMDPRLIPVYYAGPCLALGFYLLLRRPANVGVAFTAGAALAVTVAGALVFSLYYNHPNLNPVLGDKVAISVPRLQGMMESPERADTLQRLVRAFDDLGCRQRTFLTFHATPALYYLFDVEPPRGIEYLYVPYIFDGEAVLRTLQQSERWCVFVSWNWLDWPKPWPRPSTDAVMEYLRTRNSDMVRISPRQQPAHPYDDFVVYLGPAGAEGGRR